MALLIGFRVRFLLSQSVFGGCERDGEDAPCTTEVALFFQRKQLFSEYDGVAPSLSQSGRNFHKFFFFFFFGHGG